MAGAGGGRAHEHIRVGEEDSRRLPELSALGLGRVAVVRGDVEAKERGGRGVCERAQRTLLILRERLCGEEKERARGAVRLHSVQDWHQVAERLARGSGRAQRDVAPAQEAIDGVGLV